MPATATTPPRAEPIFLSGGAGPVFAVHHRASIRCRPAEARDLVYLPPFAEEANRSRRMAALLGQELAKQDTNVLVLDPYGCGDSAGHFGEARWDIWIEDVIRAVGWLRTRGAERISLLGLRLGALLALAAVPRLGRQVEQAVLWQPVVSGESMLTQFLRLHLAARLDQAGAAEGPSALRRRLAAGETVEVAGYELAPELAAAIDRLRLDQLGHEAGLPIRWLEVVAEADKPLPPAGQRVVDGWRRDEVPLRSVGTVVGAPFWALQETTLARGLIGATLAAMRSDPSARRARGPSVPAGGEAHA